eukprot:856832-Pleurochrysis_carterae.AAC.2
MHTSVPSARASAARSAADRPRCCDVCQSSSNTAAESQTKKPNGRTDKGDDGLRQPALAILSLLQSQNDAAHAEGTQCGRAPAKLTALKLVAEVGTALPLDTVARAGSGSGVLGIGKGMKDGGRARSAANWAVA